MLKFIRRNAEAAWVKFMFIAIVIVFVFWGMGGIVGSRQATFVARVNKDTIDPIDYNRAYNNMLKFYQKIYKNNFKPEMVKAIDLKQRAVDQLIQISLMQQEAKRIGLGVGSDELRDRIAAMPAFQINGRFNRNLYVRTLRANRLTPADFEDSERQDLILKKMQNLITAGVHVSEAEVRDRYMFDNEKVSLRVIKLDDSGFLPQVKLTDKEVAAYYAKHKDQFQEPARRQIAYVLYPPDHFVSKVQVTDDEVKEYYGTHESQYEKPEEVRARHILFKVPPDASAAQKAKVRKQAAAVLAQVKAGADFAKLAKKYSEDKATAADGGDLGFFTRGKMVKPFEDAAFKLAVGQTSGLVESPFGFHIIQVEAKKPARTETLEQVRPQIVDALKTEKAKELARSSADADQAAIAGGQTLAKVATAEGLTVTTSAPFAQTEATSGIGRVPALANAAFATAAGTVGPVIDTPKGFCLFSVSQKIAAHVPALAKIHDAVESAAQLAAAKDLATKKAAVVLAELQKKHDIDAVAKTEKLRVEETGPFTRQGDYIPTLGSSAELKKAAFRLSAKQPVAPAVYTVADASVVAVLKQRVPADLAKFDSQKDSLMHQAVERRKNEVLEDFVNYLKAHASIQINRDYLAGISDNGSPLAGTP